FNTTANESSKEVKVVKNPPQTETPKKPKGTISRRPASGMSKVDADKQFIELKKEKEKAMNDFYGLKSELDNEIRSRQKTETELRKLKKDLEVNRQLYIRQASELHQKYQEEMDILSKEKEKEYRTLLEEKVRSMKTDLEEKSKVVEDFRERLIEAERVAEGYRRDVMALQQELSSHTLSEKEESIRELEVQLKTVRDELESERREKEDRFGELKKQHQEEIEFLTLEKENEYKTLLDTQLECTKAEFDVHLRTIKEELERDGQSEVLRCQELETELGAMKKQLEADEQKYLKEIEKLNQKHEEEMKSLSLKKENEYKVLHDEELRLMKTQFNTDLNALREELEKNTQDGAVVRQELESELQSFKDMLETKEQAHLEAVEELIQKYEKEMETLSLKKDNEYKALLDEELKLANTQFDSRLDTLREELESELQSFKEMLGTKEQAHLEAVEELIQRYEKEMEALSLEKEKEYNTLLDEKTKFMKAQFDADLKIVYGEFEKTEEDGVVRRKLESQLEAEQQRHLREMEELNQKYQDKIQSLSLEKENEYKILLDEELKLANTQFDSRLDTLREELEKNRQDGAAHSQELQNTKDQLKTQEEKYLKEIVELSQKHEGEIKSLTLKKEKEYKALLDEESRLIKTQIDADLKAAVENLEKKKNTDVEELEAQIQAMNKELEAERKKHMKELEDLREEHREEMEFLALDKENEYSARLKEELDVYRMAQRRLEELEEKLNEADQTIADLMMEEQNSDEDSGFGSNTQTPRKEEESRPSELEVSSNDSSRISVFFVFLGLVMILFTIILCCVSVDGTVYLPFGFSFYPRLDYLKKPPM
ncbi:hypothetical protein FO519_009874, partial [Halicephalobus sp. NKZ332]